MASNYVARLLQVRPQYTKDTDSGDQPENVLWLQSGSTGTPTLAQLQSIQSFFDGNWPGVWGPMAYTGAQYIGSVITDWSSNTGLQSSSVGAFTPVAGAGGAVANPPQVCALISYQIALRYRGGHPRTYLPWVANNVIGGTNHDTISSGALTAMTTAMNHYITAMTGSSILGGQTPVIFLGKNAPATPRIFPFATFTMQPIVATQRRRVRHVGRK